MTPGDVMALAGFVAMFACAYWAGWERRDRKARRDAVSRCLDCDALKRRGGLVVVDGELRR